VFAHAHGLLAREKERAERCDELRSLITDYIMSHLPVDGEHRGTGQRDRSADTLVAALPRIQSVDSVEALELHLAFLRTLRTVGFFDFQEFIQLTGSRDWSASLSSVFLYRAYLEIEGFEGAYDVRQCVLGLNAYSRLEGLMAGDDGETVSMALLKAALELGTRGYECGFVTSAAFLYEGDVEHVGYFLQDRDLASMIATHPERVDEIVEALLSRGSFSSEESTLEIINSDAKVLSAGVL
jgi:hypothetical protein